MKVEIKVPSFGESLSEATIGAIFKQTGSSVNTDEEILELETDKVNQVLLSPASGKFQLSVKTGDVVKIGQTIGTIDTTAQGAAAPPQQKAKAAAPLPPKKEEPREETRSFPPVRKKVDEALTEMAKPTITPPSPQTPPQKPPAPRVIGRETRQKMTKLRRVIADRLVQVKNQTAMLTTFNEIDMSAIMAVREREQENFQKKYNIRLGFMSFFIKASVAALQEFPEINARLEGDEIVYPQYFNISCAVSTEKGLMVPVIQNADQLSYAEIEKRLKELAEKARSGTISVDALQGGTFTITNAGLFGSLLSTPILNPPQSGILGMHNIVKRPIAVGDQVVIRPMMYVALSYDHRIVDGREAVLFLMHIKKNLEEPARLLLDL